MVTQKKFTAVDEAFYEYGVEQSAVSELVTETQVSDWFNSIEIGEEDVVYWIHEPFMFAVISWETEKTVEYNLCTPEFSQIEEKIVSNIEGDDFTTLTEQGDYHTVVSSIKSEYNEEEDLDAVKLLSAIIQKQSDYKSIYPFAEDDNVTELNAYSGENVLVTIRNPTFQTGTVTNVVLDTYPEFVDVWNSLNSMTQSQEKSQFKDGLIGTESMFKLAKSSRGRTIHIKFYESQRISIAELIQSGFMDARVGAYLWLGVDVKESLLVSGPSEAGKTTLLRALLDLTPSNSHIASVGDGQELMVNRSHTQHYSRGEFTQDENELEFITDMLPTYLLVDNIQDERETSVLTDAMREGKTLWASTYASSIDATVHRLISEPLSIPESQVTLFGVMIQLDNVVRNTEDNKSQTVQRVGTVGEIEKQDNGFRISESFHYDGVRDDFVEDIEGSMILERIRYNRGWSATELSQEMRHREELLESLCDSGLLDSKFVQAVVRLYNQDEEGLLEACDEGGDVFESYVRSETPE